MEESEGSSSDDGKTTCRRGHWRAAEDEKLRQLVNEFGPHNWNSIAEKIDGRSGKSCRLRWFNQINPGINKTPFTETEEEMLLQAQQIYGNRWSFIARHFPGRTDNALKNQFHVMMARKQKNQPPKVFQSKPTNSNPNIFGGFLSPPPLGYPYSDWSSSSSSSAAAWKYGGGLTRDFIGSSSLSCINKHGLDHSLQDRNSYARYQSLNASQSVPTFELAAPFMSFGFPNAYGTSQQSQIAQVVNDSSGSATTLSMVNQQESGDDESSNKKDVPFIDFLGISSSR